MTRLMIQISQHFRFPSLPRQRESSNPLKDWATRFRGYDEFKGLGENPVSLALLQCGQGAADSLAISRIRLQAVADMAILNLARRIANRTRGVLE